MQIQTKRLKALGTGVMWQTGPREMWAGWSMARRRRGLEGAVLYALLEETRKPEKRRRVPEISIKQRWARTTESLSSTGCCSEPKRANKARWMDDRRRRRR